MTQDQKDFENRDIDNDESLVLEYLNGEYEPAEPFDLLRHDLLIHKIINHQLKSGHIDRIIFEERMKKQQEVYEHYISRLKNEKERL